MARINLLPWRDWERERKKKKFLTNLGAVAVAGGVLVFAGHTYLDSQLDRQKSRNDWLRSEITQLDTRIAEIRNLRQERDQLLARMHVIQGLQGNRPVIVRVFDELVRTNANGVFYANLRMDGPVLQMNGTAESNNRISTLMRNLDTSEWFSEPNLKGIRENTAFGPQASNFQLTVRQIDPNAAATGADTSAMAVTDQDRAGTRSNTSRSANRAATSKGK
jgi:type IV pilus assembly protein PilN